MTGQPIYRSDSIGQSNNRLLIVFKDIFYINYFNIFLDIFIFIYFFD